MSVCPQQDGTSRYAVTLIVQYTSSPDILQSSDQSVQATCDFSPNTSLSLTLGNITLQVSLLSVVSLTVVLVDVAAVMVMVVEVVVVVKV